MTTMLVEPRTIPDYEAIEARDSRLYQRHLDGDREAMKELVESYQNLIGKHVSRTVQDPEARDDLFQECVLAVYEAVRKYDPSRGRLSKAIRFFIKIRCLEWLGRWRKGRARGYDPDAEGLDPIELATASPETSPEENERAGNLHRSLSRLPARQRKVLTLRYGLDGGGERSYGKIGRLMGGIGSAYVGRLLIRARRDLADMIGPDPDSPPPSCPDCGSALGKNNRCYACKPAGVRLRPGKTVSPGAVDVVRARAVLSSLPAEQASVLTLRYGLDGGGERGRLVIANRLGFTESKVWRLEVKGIESLKRIAGDDIVTFDRENEAPTGAGKETDVGEFNGAAVMNGRAPTRPDPETIEVSASAARPCPKCGGPLKGPTGTRCYKCSPPGKPAAGGKKPKKRHTLKSIDEAGWPPVRKVGPGDPLPIPAEDREALARMLPRLPKNESLVITYRLGLDGHGRRTQEQAGKLIGYGGTAAGKFEGQAVARLLAQGLDISPYLARRPPSADDPEDVLPLPEGFPTGKKKAASSPPAPAKPPAPAPPSGAEAEVRWSMIRLLAGLERDAAARILHDVAIAVGVATA